MTAYWNMKKLAKGKNNVRLCKKGFETTWLMKRHIRVRGEW